MHHPWLQRVFNENILVWANNNSNLELRGGTKSRKRVRQSPITKFREYSYVTSYLTFKQHIALSSSHFTLHYPSCSFLSLSLHSLLSAYFSGLSKPVFLYLFFLLFLLYAPLILFNLSYRTPSRRLKLGFLAVFFFFFLLGVRKPRNKKMWQVGRLQKNISQKYWWHN